MKVRCVRTSMKRPDKNVINGDMREYLVVGSTFWVYGINFRKGTSYCYIFDENHLFEVLLFF